MAAPLVIGTTNPAKARNIRAALQGMPYELLEPTEVLSELPDVSEDAIDVAQNALRKAIAFAAAANLPAISLDYGLCFDGLPDEAQPGMNVRRIPGTDGRPSDEELLRYYADLFKRHGGEVRGRWVIGLAAATPSGETAHTTTEIRRRFVSAPSTARVPGYPLASLQLVGERYVADLDEGEDERLSQEVLREPLRALVDELLGAPAGRNE